MTTTSSVPALHGTATVNLPLTQAFTFFTGSMGRWWPKEYHIGQADMLDTVLEPRVDGRWYERGADGSECDWGRVLAWEPPDRLVVTWQINGHWQFDEDPQHASEIEVNFNADGPSVTTVNLDHRHLDRLVEGQAMRDQIAGGGGGWGTVLDRFASTAAAPGR
jgi:uncharacterized protein YndB with AHSA1/START domain